MQKLYDKFPASARKSKHYQVSTHQFFGIDNNQFAVELAKVMLMLARSWRNSIFRN